MMRLTVLAIVACLALVGCDRDPARAMKIVAAPPAAPAEPIAPPPIAVAPPVPSAIVVPAKSEAPPPPEKKASEPLRSKEWRPPGCPVPAESASGPSTLVVDGPCAFRHQGTFSCEAMVDDLYISMTRKAARGTTLMVYINVENYHGPGDYKHAQVFMSVQDKSSIYRWSDDSASITVGPDQAYAVLPTTHLEAEPLLVDCTGPMNNYQCGGRTDMQQLLATAHVVSGKLQCEAQAKNK